MRHDSFRTQFAFSLQSNPVVRQLHYLAGGKCNPDIPVIKSCLKKTKSDANDRDLAASALDTVGRTHTDSTTSQIAIRKDVWQVARVTYQEDLLLVHTFLMRIKS